MAVDKNKLVAEATRFVQKGQWDKAIKAYEKVYAEDRRDTRVLLKIGELQQKKGDNPAAAATLNLVAEAYREQGFFLKAVSVYKQVAKLAPDDLRVNERLAELYQQLGLMSEAMGQLQAVAVALERTGEQGRLLDILRRMVDLDPDNVASGVKLGDLYTKAGKNAEALELFRRAASTLRENKRVDEYLKVAERIALLAPDDIKLTRELAHAYLSRGDTKRALAKLQLCFKAEPKDVETLRLLAQAFRDLGQSSKTTSVYKELARVYEERGRRDEARLTWKQVLELTPDDPDAQEALGARPPQVPGAAAPAAPAPRPGPAPPPMPAAGRRPAQAAASGGADAVARLLTEADVYRKYGLHQKALEHLQKLLAQDPEHADALERVSDLREALGDRAGAAQAAESAARALLERGPEERARAAVERLRALDPARPALAELAAAAGLEWGPGGGAAVGAGEDDLALAHAAEAADEVVAEEAAEAVVSADARAGAEAAGQETGSAATVEGEPVEALADDDVSLVSEDELLAVEPGDAGPAVQADDEVLTAPLDVGEEAVSGDALEDAGPGAIILEPPAEALGFEPEPEPRGPEEVPAAGAPAVAPAEAGLPAPAELELAPEEGEGAGAPLPAVGPEDAGLEFVPEEEGAGAGAEVPAELPPPGGLEFVPEEEAGPESASGPAPAPPEAGAEGIPEPGGLEFLPEAEGEPGPAAGAALQAGQEPAQGPEPRPEPEPAAVAPAAGLEDLSEELEEIAFYEGQGLLDEALDAVRDLVDAHPGHPLLRERQADLEAQLAAREGGGAGTASPTAPAGQPTAPPVPEAPVAPAEPATGAAPPGAVLAETPFDIGRELAAELETRDVPAPSAGDFQYSVEDVFDQFKRGVEQAVRPEDSDTHYDLGIAYKEMGLLDDAIGEFRTALSGNNRRKEVDILSMIGLCQSLKGEHREAVQAYRRALHSEYLTGDAAKALHYELGAAHEALGESAVALWYFQKIVKVDPRYRDVRARVDRLGGGPGQPPANVGPSPRAPSDAGPAATPAPTPAPAAGGPAPDGSSSGPKKNIGYV
jgi:tetratricopeptide (TPR) repeat protein